MGMDRIDGFCTGKPLPESTVPVFRGPETYPRLVGFFNISVVRSLFSEGQCWRRPAGWSVCHPVPGFSGQRTTSVPW